MGMQIGTMLKFGGMAFDVARDERVQQMAMMIHKGAKRRGLYGSHTQYSAPAAVKSPARVPFAPTAPASSSGPTFSKYFTADNAKKAIDIASSVGSLLLK
jgi:hypothetical protein